MTQTAAEAAQSAASQNGKPAPADPAGAPCEDCVPASERLMGVLGLLFAAALGVIALDLLTGGWVSSTVSRLTGTEGGDGDGTRPE